MPTNNQEKWEVEYHKKFPCIQRGCDNNGSIAERVGEDDWEQQQCQYCDQVRFPTIDFLRQEIRQAKIESLDVAEMLWVVLANVSEGDWTKQTKEWQEAAAKWRDNYLNAISNLKKHRWRQEVKN